MDKRFESVTQKMEGLIIQSKELQNSVSELFNKVDSAQTEIDNKLGATTTEIHHAIDGFKSESEKLFSDIGDLISEKKNKMDSSIDEIREKLNSIQLQYETNVAEFIKSIGDKSIEILKIYDELEKIKSTHEKALGNLVQLEYESQQLIEGQKKRGEEILEGTQVGALISRLDTLEKEVEKLKWHAHKHTFGGTKV